MWLLDTSVCVALINRADKQCGDALVRKESAVATIAVRWLTWPAGGTS